MASKVFDDQLLNTLHRSILTDPFDMLPRYAFADRLEELGDVDQAEALRQQLGEDREIVYIGSSKLDYGLDAAREAHGFLYCITARLGAFFSNHRVYFSLYPIYHVDLVGRTPTLSSDGRLCGWASDRRGVPSRHLPLPASLFDLLDGQLTRHSSSHTMPEQLAFYSTSEEAFSALSRACVQYGRRMVGLPPLDYPRHLRQFPKRVRR